MRALARVGRRVLLLLVLAGVGGCAAAGAGAKPKQGVDDHYASLGMQQGSTEESLRRAYHHLSLKYVPVRQRVSGPFRAHPCIRARRQHACGPRVLNACASLWAQVRTRVRLVHLRLPRAESCRNHPDKNRGSEKAEATFIKVQRAYAVLKDPKRRAVYHAVLGQTRKTSSRPSRAAQSAAKDVGQAFTFQYDGRALTLSELVALVHEWERASSTVQGALRTFRSFLKVNDAAPLRPELSRFLSA